MYVHVQCKRTHFVSILVIHNFIYTHTNYVYTHTSTCIIRNMDACKRAVYVYTCTCIIYISKMYTHTHCIYGYIFKEGAFTWYNTELPWWPIRANSQGNCSDKNLPFEGVQRYEAWASIEGWMVDVFFFENQRGYLSMRFVLALLA